MSDTDLKRQNSAEEQTAEPMPSSDQPVEGTQEPASPDGVNPRTAEQFEKLTSHNKELAERARLAEEKLAALENPNSFQFIPPTLDENLPNQDLDTDVPSPRAGETSSNEQDFIDDGGYVDTARLNSKLSRAEREAMEAKKAVQQLQAERQQERLEAIKAKAFAEFPEFVAESGDRFDPKFDYKVKLELTRQLVEEGKQDYLKAARKVKEEFYPKPSQEAEEAKREEIISSREQASAQTSAGTGSSEPLNQDELVEGTRAGDAEAIFKRLQASGN